ncbi:MAG: hypothetical protein ABFD54_05330 [Armatimonadota bacterium]|nr:hypothetical protein [bacterium]
MRRRSAILTTLFLLLITACLPVLAEQVTGELTSVSNDVITANFPVPIRSKAMMTIMAGSGESVAGLAIAQKCTGDKPPYQVTGALYFSTDAVAITAGKRVMVSSANASPAPSVIKIETAKSAQAQPSRIAKTDQDLKFYYYAAGQTVGYGAFGLGYERTIKISRGVGIEADAAITTLGNVSTQDSSEIDTQQVIKNLTGKVKMDFGRGFGVYTGYRWNQGRGDDEKWSQLISDLDGQVFTSPSSSDTKTVLLKGLEYGLTLRPMSKMSLSVGYIPEYFTDYGSVGVLSQPAYTAELRLGGGSGSVRLRGISTEDYWLADLGITIR